MSRPKKAEDKAKEATNITHISINDFLETRNTVVTGLSTLQSAISDLSRSYLNHTDNLIGSRTGSLNFAANVLGPENGFFSARGPTPGPVIEAAPETKKRKRAPHDKNAPKRALTPFFLYLQSARSVIASEMGSGHTAKEVQDEGGRRWREMPEKEKEKWTEQYGVNLARYRERVKAYKAGQPLPEISDAEARRLYEQSKTINRTANSSHLGVNTSPTRDDSSESSDTSSSEDESSEPVRVPSPVPEPTKKKANKEGSKKRALAAEPEPILDPALRSPERKKLGKKSKGAETSETKKIAEMPAISPPKAGEKQKKKKRKNAAGE